MADLVDAYASRPHLIDHLAPIWVGLAPEQRGTFYVGGPRQLVAYAAERGIDARWGMPHNPGPACLVAAYNDYTQLRPERPAVYLEHGAGQTYRIGTEPDQPWHSAYSGGRNRGRVGLFLTLNESTAARERARYPDAEVAVVGSPRLDGLASWVPEHLVLPVGIGAPTMAATRASSPTPARVAVAFAWHWDCGLVPETRSAWPHWRGMVADRAAAGDQILGHGHPRAWRELAPWYDRHGIEAAADFGEVIARADVLCFDNSSAGYEAAACGVPVVALNAPWYRREVEHGLRFWDQVPGPQVDHPADFDAAVEEACSDEWADRRREVTSLVYPPETRGQATRLAVEAISALPVPG